MPDTSHSGDSSEDEDVCFRRLQNAIEDDDILSSFVVSDLPESAVADDDASTCSDATETATSDSDEERDADGEVGVHEDVEVDLLIESEAERSRPLRFPATPSPGTGDPRYLQACRSCLLTDNPLLQDPSRRANGMFVLAATHLCCCEWILFTP